MNKIICNYILVVLLSQCEPKVLEVQHPARMVLLWQKNGEV